MQAFAPPAKFTTKVEITAPGAGNWLVPAGITLVWVTLVGAGGGGQGSAGAGQPAGGGGGQTWHRIPWVVTPGANVPYTVGLGGVGASAGNNGTGGGNTLWDGFLTAYGGTGGGSTGAAGANGGGERGYEITDLAIGTIAKGGVSSQYSVFAAGGIRGADLGPAEVASTAGALGGGGGGGCNSGGAGQSGFGGGGSFGPGGNGAISSTVQRNGSNGGNGLVRIEY